jgi:WD40 repeat protein
MRRHTFDSGDVIALVFSRTGRTLITGSSRIKFWHLQTGKVLRTVNSGSSDLALSPDGQVLLSANGSTLDFWQLPLYRPLGSLHASDYSGLSIAFGLAGQVIVTSSSDGLQIWRSQLFLNP